MRYYSDQTGWWEGTDILQTSQRNLILDFINRTFAQWRHLTIQLLEYILLQSSLCRFVSRTSDSSRKKNWKCVCACVCVCVCVCKREVLSDLKSTTSPKRTLFSSNNEASKHQTHFLLYVSWSQAQDTMRSHSWSRGCISGKTTWYTGKPQICFYRLEEIFLFPSLLILVDRVFILLRTGKVVCIIWFLVLIIIIYTWKIFQPMINEIRRFSLVIIIFEHARFFSLKRSTIRDEGIS